MKNTLLEAVFADMLALQKSIPSDYSYIRGASVQYAIDDKAINADCICEGPIGCVGFGEGTREDEHKYATTHPGDNRNPYIEQYVLWEQGLVPDFDAAYEKARLRAVAAKKKH
jgi:hypothetical protein